MSWWKNLKKPGKLCEPLKAHTTFKIGGPAKLFFRPGGFEELRQIVENCRKSGLKVLVLGAGSNILVSDRGIRAAVVKLDSAGFSGISNVENTLVIGAGKTISHALVYCRTQGLSGLEFMAGIPGTIGGALAGNAGVRVNGKSLSIGDLVESVTVLDYNNNLKVLDRANLKFGYRQSNLARYIILSASLRLNTGNKKKPTENVSFYLGRRKNTQDYSFPNAGCVFKNPPGDSAGRLIDACHLKGRKIGSAAVSSKHANFIVNTGNASAKDVIDLMNLVKREVKKKYNIVLKPEIKIWK
jgi:UDP-N-acetylmuramate dehydrogenase